MPPSFPSSLRRSAVSRAQLELSAHTVDYHTAGEPFRIVVSGATVPPGDTVRERRSRALTDPDLDLLRRMLCHEPRGHADMYGCFLTPPDNPGAHFGALFWHKDGYSTACGHGTIALGAWAVESGRVPGPRDGTTEVVIDVPSGRVVARVERRAGRTEAVTFLNVPSYVLARNLFVEAAGRVVPVDISFGGAIYACMRASDLGLAVTPEHCTELIAAGRAVKAALAGSSAAEHPSDPLLSGIYGTILYDDLGESARGPHQRNVTVFADGEVDRSPCGSGTSARVALLVAEGRLGPGQHLVHDSIVGSRFTAEVVERVTVEGRDAVVTEVCGMAHRTGEHHFVHDQRDPLGPGFVLR